MWVKKVYSIILSHNVNYIKYFMYSFCFGGVFLFLYNYASPFYEVDSVIRDIRWAYSLSRLPLHLHDIFIPGEYQTMYHGSLWLHILSFSFRLGLSLAGIIKLVYFLYAFIFVLILRFYSHGRLQSVGLMAASIFLALSFYTNALTILWNVTLFPVGQIILLFSLYGYIHNRNKAVSLLGIIIGNYICIESHLIGYTLIPLAVLVIVLYTGRVKSALLYVVLTLYTHYLLSPTVFLHNMHILMKDVAGYGFLFCLFFSVTVGYTGYVYKIRKMKIWIDVNWIFLVFMLVMLTLINVGFSRFYGSDTTIPKRFYSLFIVLIAVVAAFLFEKVLQTIKNNFKILQGDSSSTNTKIFSIVTWGVALLSSFLILNTIPGYEKSKLSLIEIERISKYIEDKGYNPIWVSNNLQTNIQGNIPELISVLMPQDNNDHEVSNKNDVGYLYKRPFDVSSECPIDSDDKDYCIQLALYPSAVILNAKILCIQVEGVQQEFCKDIATLSGEHPALDKLVYYDIILNNIINEFRNAFSSRRPIVDLQIDYAITTGNQHYYLCLDKAYRFIETSDQVRCLEVNENQSVIVKVERIIGDTMIGPHTRIDKHILKQFPALLFNKLQKEDPDYMNISSVHLSTLSSP